jgi:F-type H+-transporting ATPase subunit delta
MKITAKQYARGLQEATAGKTDQEAKDIIAKFLLILVKRGKIKLVPRIIKELEVLGRIQRGEVLAELITARDLSAESKQLLESYIKKQNGESQVVWQETIDETLIGGGVIKFQDRILDFSLQRALQEIKKVLIK